jgi:hypothetical protein
MKSACSMLALIVLWGAFSGCGSAGPTMQWERLAETATCEAMNPAYCPAGNSFTVDTQGNFTAGPSPSGKTVKGQITAQELVTLNADANAVLLAGAALHCHSGASVPGSSDMIDAFSASGMQLPVYTTINGECFAHSDSSGTTLRNFFQQLRSTYYPIPFPS